MINWFFFHLPYELYTYSNNNQGILWYYGIILSKCENFGEKNILLKNARVFTNIHVNVIVEHTRHVLSAIWAIQSKINHLQVLEKYYSWFLNASQLLHNVFKAWKIITSFSKDILDQKTILYFYEGNALFLYIYI